MKSEYREIFKHIKSAIKAMKTFDDDKLEENLRMAHSLTECLVRKNRKEERKRNIERSIAQGNELCYKCGGEGWCWGYELINYEYDGIDDTRYTCDICDGVGWILPKLNVIHDEGPEPEDL